MLRSPLACFQLRTLNLSVSVLAKRYGLQHQLMTAKVATWDDFIAPNPRDILGLTLGLILERHPSPLLDWVGDPREGQIERERD